MQLHVKKFNNHWSVRDEQDNRVSNWYRNKCEAYTAKLDIELENAQQELDLDDKPDTYQVLNPETGRYIKYVDSQAVSEKKSDGAYKNIPIVEI